MCIYSTTVYVIIIINYSAEWESYVVDIEMLLRGIRILFSEEISGGPKEQFEEPLRREKEGEAHWRCYYYYWAVGYVIGDWGWRDKGYCNDCYIVISWRRKNT